MREITFGNGLLRCWVGSGCWCWWGHVERGNVVGAGEATLPRSRPILILLRMRLRHTAHLRHRATPLPPQRRARNRGMNLNINSTPRPYSTEYVYVRASISAPAHDPRPIFINGIATNTTVAFQRSPIVFLHLTDYTPQALIS